MRSLVVVVTVITLLAACRPAAATPSISPTPLPTLPPLGTSPPLATPTPHATPTPTPAPVPTATKAAAPIRYVAIGASDTVGIGSVDPTRGSWPSRIAMLLPPGSTYRNLGVAGSLAAQAAHEQLPAAVAEDPDLVTIWLAVNDINAQVSDKDYATALNAIVDGLTKTTHARIFIGDVPDLRAVPAYAGVDRSKLIAVVAAYNEVIRGIAAQHSDRVVVVDLFTGSAALMTQVTVSPDGFHPSDVGYELIAERFAAAMRKSGVALR